MGTNAHQVANMRWHQRPILWQSIPLNQARRRPRLRSHHYVPAMRAALEAWAAGVEGVVGREGVAVLQAFRPARRPGAVQRARIIVPVTRATIVLIEVGPCARALWTRPKPTTSVTQANAS